MTLNSRIMSTTNALLALGYTLGAAGRAVNGQPAALRRDDDCTWSGILGQTVPCDSMQVTWGEHGDETKISIRTNPDAANNPLSPRPADLIDTGMNCTYPNSWISIDGFGDLTVDVGAGSGCQWQEEEKYAGGSADLLPPELKYGADSVVFGDRDRCTEPANNQAPVPMSCILKMT